MPDFSKLATQPRQVDYLAYLIDEHKLTDWESTFCKSCLTGLRTKYQWLTQKQNACLDKMIVKYNLKTDEFCVRGYADRTDTEVIRNSGTGTKSTKMQQAGDADMDDDIPF